MKLLIFLSLLFSANAHADLGDQGLRNWTLSNSTDAVGCAQQGTWTVTSSGSSTVTQGTSPWVSNISQFGGNNVVTGAGTGGSGIPRVTVSNDSNVLATQSGAWTTGRTWSLLNTTDSVNAVQSGTWTTGRTWSLSASTDAVNVGQFGGTSVVTGTGASGSGIPRVTVANDSNVLATQSGTWVVNAIFFDGNKATYSASIVNLVSPATATDVFTITGSATKLVRINHIEVSYTQSASNIRDFLLIKRSSANTGGTSSTLTNVAHDSNNAAGTATIRAYTANPSALGTTVGTIRAGKNWSATGTGGSSAFIAGLVWDFGNRPSQTIVLRGTSEVLSLNLNATTITTPAINIAIEWTEE